MGFINPFEIVVARKPRVIFSESVGPELPTICVFGINYEIAQDRRVRLPEILIHGSAPVKLGNVGVGYYSTPMPHDPFSPIVPPEVQLRKAARACVNAGISTESMEEIVRLECIDFVINC